MTGLSVELEYDAAERKAMVRFGSHRVTVRNVSREDAVKFAEGWRRQLSRRSEEVGDKRALEEGFVLNRIVR